MARYSSGQKLTLNQQLFLGVFHPTFIFVNPPAYGWYLSSTAILLNISWSLHNVIAWLKTRPFLSRKWSIFYITTVIMVQPYWVLEIYSNFAFFNNVNNLFETTRPYEALFRDPWWASSVLILMFQIHQTYKLPVASIVTLSPRFGILLLAMTLSIIFVLLDVIAVTTNSFASTLPDGLNPWWKLAMVFKCLTDSIILDDFKTALDRLMKFKLRREGHRQDRHDRGGSTQTTSEVAIDEEEGIRRPCLTRNQTVEHDPFSEDARERTFSGTIENHTVDFATALKPSFRSLTHSEKVRKVSAMASSSDDSYDDIDLPNFQTGNT